MRAETRARLDALERAERRKRYRISGMIAVVVCVAAVLYAWPSSQLGAVEAQVETSFLGVDAWGQHYHSLRAKLASGAIVPVKAPLVHKVLHPGRIIVLDRQQGLFGGITYELHPAAISSQPTAKALTEPER